MDNRKNQIDFNEYSKCNIVFEKLMKLINIYSEHEINPRTYGTDEIYYSLEIHTIYIIGKSPGINLTDIAHSHGISKSAVSKVIKKLEKKGAVHRYKMEDNKKEVLFELTDKGKEAYYGHIEYHEVNQKMLINMLKEIPNEKVDIFLEMVDIFITYGESLIKK